MAAIEPVPAVPAQARVQVQVDAQPRQRDDLALPAVPALGQRRLTVGSQLAGPVVATADGRLQVAVERGLLTLEGALPLPPGTRVIVQITAVSPTIQGTLRLAATPADARLPSRAPCVVVTTAPAAGDAERAGNGDAADADGVGRVGQRAAGPALVWCPTFSKPAHGCRSVSWQQVRQHRTARAGRPIPRPTWRNGRRGRPPDRCRQPGSAGWPGGHAGRRRHAPAAAGCRTDAGRGSGAGHCRPAGRRHRPASPAPSRHSRPRRCFAASGGRRWMPLLRCRRQTSAAIRAALPQANGTLAHHLQALVTAVRSGDPRTWLGAAALCRSRPPPPGPARGTHP